MEVVTVFTEACLILILSLCPSLSLSCSWCIKNIGDMQGQAELSVVWSTQFSSPPLHTRSLSPYTPTRHTTSRLCTHSPLNCPCFWKLPSTDPSAKSNQVKECSCVTGRMEGTGGQVKLNIIAECYSWWKCSQYAQATAVHFYDI